MTDAVSGGAQVVSFPFAVTETYKDKYGLLLQQQLVG